MYLPHFGLNQAPFGITPNPAFFYSGSKRGDILDALIYAVTHGEGIIKVTGEVGSGKTMLCRMLESMMPANVEVIYLVNPTLSREEVVFAIAGELEIATGGKRPDEVIRLLHHDLITKHVTGKQVVLLVEEAQAMPLETLEEIRLFSNLETAHHKLLQIVLFGQPELDESLNLPRMRQLKERITHSFKVPPMTPTVIPEFLMFRMRAAGYHGPDIFSKGAIKLLAAVSEGIVRRINILADKSLLAAFADNTHSIQTRHIRAAIQDSEFSTTKLPRPRKNLAIGLMLSVAVIVAADIGWRTYGPNGPALHAPISASAPVAIAVAPSPVPQASRAAVAPPPPPPAPPVSIDQASAGSVTTAAPQTLTPAATVDNPIATPSQTSPAVSILQQQVAVSQNWLRDGAHNRYTIQIALIDTDDHTKIEQALKKAGEEVGLDQLHLYPTRIDRAPHFGIVYSGFNTREEARIKRVELERKWGYHAQLRTIGGLRAEMQRSHSEDMWPK